MSWLAWQVSVINECCNAKLYILNSQSALNSVHVDNFSSSEFNLAAWLLHLIGNDTTNR